MNRKYIYKVYNKIFEVLPFSEYDEYLLRGLDNKVKNYFIDQSYNNNVYKVIIVSGNITGIKNSFNYNMDILKRISSSWFNLNKNYKNYYSEWYTVMLEYLEALDYQGGVFKLKAYKNVFVILSDVTNVEKQMYKIHCGLEFLLIYLTSFENSVMFHSSSAGFSTNNFYLFVGESGSGKSTIAKKIGFKKGYIVDDERNFVVKDSKEYKIYSGQTKSINNKFGYYNTGFGTLKGILLLYKSDYEKIEPRVYDTSLLDRIKKANMEVGGYRKALPELNKKLILYFIEKLLKEIPVYNLYSKYDTDIQKMILTLK